MVDEKAQTVEDSGEIQEDEEVLAVVVTNVDISNASSLQVPSSLYGIDVEFIVSSGVHSYCVRQALNDFIQVLQLLKNSTQVDSFREQFIHLTHHRHHIMIHLKPHV